jgi:hypothetical protein
MRFLNKDEVVLLFNAVVDDHLEVFFIKRIGEG